jgi:hypothetical protein
MSPQLTLFEIPAHGRARREDPATSKAAAATAPAADLSERILRALRLSKAGMTTRELAWLLKADLVSVSPRMRPLVEGGKVLDSGEKRVGDNGRASIVWRAA